MKLDWQPWLSLNICQKRFSKLNKNKLLAKLGLSFFFSFVEWQTASWDARVQLNLSFSVKKSSKNVVPIYWNYVFFRSKSKKEVH